MTFFRLQGYHGMSSRDRRQSRGSDDDRQQGRRSSDDRSPQARGSSQQQTEDMREASKRPRDGVRELEKDTETTSSSGRPDRNAKQGPRESQPTMKDATKQGQGINSSCRYIGVISHHYLMQRRENNVL